jgi:hypothetical protein
MIDLPFWSTLMPSFKEAWLIAYHDQRIFIPPLTSVLDGTRHTHVPSLAVQTICG